MARRSAAEIPWLPRILRDLGGATSPIAAGARLAFLVRRGGHLATIVALLSGCLVTNPVDFNDPVEIPPVIVDSAKLPNGSIVKVNVDDPGANEIRLPVTIREDNVSRVLKVRTRITKSDTTIEYTCPEPELLPTGTNLRSYDIVIDKTSLNRGECARVELVVSGSFGTCQIDQYVDLRFDFAQPTDDIARATFWIWEVSGSALADAQSALRLANTCKLIDKTSSSAKSP